MQVTGASFPSRQLVGQTSLMKIDVSNTGQKTVPTLTVTVNIEGKAGEAAQIPFAVHDPRRGSPTATARSRCSRRPTPASPAPGPGGARPPARRPYSFGPVKPGKSVEAVWKLSAVRAGKYTVGYEIDAGLSGETKAKTSSGVAPGGSFVADITTSLPETEVNVAGEIVEIKRGK